MTEAVNSFYRTDEFFDIEGFKGRDDFFMKATSYLWYYNFLRRNSNRKDKGPLHILKVKRDRRKNKSTGVNAVSIRP